MPDIVSLNPDTFTESAYVDDVDATLTDCRFVLFDYNGKLDSPVPVLQVTMDIDRFERPHIEKYSMGNKAAGDFTPSSDGKTLVPVRSGVTLNKRTLAGVWLKELVQAGFPKTRMNGDLSEIDGLKCHLRAIPNPLKGKDGTGGRDTILVVESIQDSGSSKSSSAPASDDIDEKAAGVIERLMEANSGNLPKDIMRACLDLLKKDGVSIKDRMIIAKRAADQEFIDSLVTT